MVCTHAWKRNKKPVSEVPPRTVPVPKKGGQGHQTRTPTSERHGRHDPGDNDLMWVQGGSTGESPGIMSPREAQVRPCLVTADRNKPSLGQH